MTTYTFRVWLRPNDRMNYDPFSRAWRDIKVDASHTLEEFHEAIFDAFDRWDEQEYAFTTRSEHGMQTRRYLPPEEYDGGPSWEPWEPAEVDQFFETKAPDAPEEAQEQFRELRQNPPPEGNTAETTIADLEPEDFGGLHYVFDFDHAWEHDIELQETGEDSLDGDPKLVNEAGAPPDQYTEPGA